MIVEIENGDQSPLDVGVFGDTLMNMLTDREKLARYGKRSLVLSEKYSIEGQARALEHLYFESILQNWRGSLVSRISARLKF
jgi:hypothetical protein